MAGRHFFLIDGSGFIFRAYHALPPMNRPDGTPVNAVFGFCNMLQKVLDEIDGHDSIDHIAVIFDAARENFRNEIYPDYKGHRPDAPEDLVPQFPLIRAAVRAFNVACVEMEGYEADDLIATYARQAREAGDAVTIVSSDKDLMQLIRDGVSMRDPIKNTPIGTDEVLAKFGVAPAKVVEVQALAGDATDNVPGVPGIGVKTAAQLIGEYGDLETLLSRAGEIKQPKRRESLIEHAENARISRQLVLLKDDVPVAETLEDFKASPPDPDVLLPFLKEQSFKRLLDRWDNGGAAGDHPTAAGHAVDHAPAYELIQDETALEAFIAEAMTKPVIAVDTETDSLDVHLARLVGISIATAPGRACYIPLDHTAPDAAPSLDLGDGQTADAARPQQVPIDRAAALLRPLFEDPGRLKVGHNIKYDLHVLAKAGLRPAPIDDSCVISYLLDGPAHGHGLDELALLHFDHTTIKFADVCGSGRNRITFDKVPLDSATDYAAEDADYTLRLYQKLKPQILKTHLVRVHERLDRPLIDVLFEMEGHGILVDTARLKELSRDFATRMGALETEIHELAGESFNIGSPKQLGEILFGKMGLSGGRKSSKTGAYSTGADVLETLAHEGHDLPRKVLDWRALAKLKSTYTDALVEQAAKQPDGRVRTSFSQTVASTGRLSSNDPNLQNIPIRTEDGRKIRTAFVAPKGRVLISADYSQIELRLLAHVADIPALKQAFAEGQDIHAITASQVFGIPVDGMDPMVRRSAKAINFGIIYGISGFGLAKQLDIPRAEAQGYIDTYFKRYPEIRDYMEETKAFAREHGYVLTPFGRKCVTAGIADKNPNMRGFAERAAINAPIQGGAADIIKRAMVRLLPALKDRHADSKLLLQVHDELVIEAPETDAEAVIATTREIMEGAAELSVPLIVDAGHGRTWAEAH